MKWLALMCICMLIFLFASCDSDKVQSEYVVNGHFPGLKDSSEVQFKIKDSVINSAFVMADKFQLKGYIDEPENITMIVKGERNRKDFWLSNDTIRLNGTSSSLRSGTISGSPLQELREMQEAATKPIYNKFKEVNQAIRKRGGNKDSLKQKRQEFLDEMYQQQQEFVEAHPNSPESLRILQISKDLWGFKVVKKLYTLMNKKSHNSKDGKSIGKYISLHKELKIGNKFIDFTIIDTSRVSMAFSKSLGKFTLLEFWSSWCGSCRKSNPSLVKLYNEYHSKGLEIVGVSLDESIKSWKTAIIKDKLEWIHSSDLKGVNDQAASIYGVSAIPDNFLIDEEGIIIARGLSVKELKEFLDTNSTP